MDQALVGMRVRDGQGRKGLIAEASDKSLRIHWTDKSTLQPLAEDIATADRKALGQVELLTLQEGWQPLLAATSALLPKPPKTLLEDLQQILNEAERPSSKPSRKTISKGSAPAKKSGASREKAARSRKGRAGMMNPFKTKSHLGPGPRGSENHEKDEWKCKCTTPYRCRCISRLTKRKKTIRIGRDYKKTYNHDYKAWVKNQKR